MSQWQPLDPRNQFSDAPTKQSWESPRPSSCLVPVMLLGGVVLAVALCAGVGVHFVQRGSSTVNLIPRETPAEKISAATAGFAADDPGVDRETLRQITRLMNELTRAAQREDEAEFQRLVDFDRMMVYLKQSPAGQRQNFVELMVLKPQLKNGTGLDEWMDEITIRHVDPIAPGAIVYAHGIADDGGVSEMKIWIEGDGDDWRVVDWERLDLGLRHSETWALYSKYSDDTRLDAYFDGNDEVHQAIELETGDKDNESVELLRRAEARSVPEELRDSYLVLTAYAWQRLGHYDEAQQCLDKVRSSDGTPGTYFCRAMCHSGQEDYVAALDSANRYEATVGPAPDVCRFKAQWLEILDRESEALAEWRKVLRVVPEDISALREFARLLPKDAKDELAEHLARSATPLELAESLIDYARNDVETLAAIERFIAAREPESARVAHLRGLVLNAEEDYEAGAAQFRRAVELAEEMEIKQQYDLEYINAMNECNQVVEGYESAFDRSAVLQYLFSEGDGSNIEIADEERVAILSKHSAFAPDDPWADCFRGARHQEREEYDASASALAAAISKIDDDDENADLFRQAHAISLSHAGRAVEALTANDASPESFLWLLRDCRRADRWQDLEPLAAAFRSRHPDDPLNDYCAGLILARDEQWGEAEAKLAQLTNIEEDWRYALESDLAAIRARPERWREAYDQAEDQSDMFLRLVSEMFDSGRHDDVNALIERHLAAHPDALEAANWDAQNAAAVGKESDFVERWWPHRDELLDAAANWQTGQTCRTLWRLLLELGRRDEAWEFVSALQERQKDVEEEAAFHALAGNVDECIAAARQSSGTKFGFGLYSDPDAGRIVRSLEYAALQEEFPPTPQLFRDVRGPVIILLLREPLANLEQTLREAFDADRGKEFGVTSVPQLPHRGRTFVVSHDSARFRIAEGQERLKATPPLESSWRPPAEVDLYRQSQAWLEFCELDAEINPNLPDNLEALRDAISRVADTNCLAIYLYHENRLIPWNDATQTALRQGETLPDWRRLGIHANMFVDEPVEDPRPRRTFQRQLKQTLKSFVDGRPTGRFQIEFELTDYAASEMVRLDVEEFQEEENRFVGRLTADVLTQPSLRQGLRLTIYRDDVRGAHITDEQGERHIAIAD